MPTKMNRSAYQSMIKEDITWLINSTTRSLERDHIRIILEQSVDLYYPKKLKDEIKNPHNAIRTFEDRDK